LKNKLNEIKHERKEKMIKPLKNTTVKYELIPHTANASYFNSKTEHENKKNVKLFVPRQQPNRRPSMSPPTNAPQVPKIQESLNFSQDDTA